MTEKSLENKSVTLFIFLDGSLNGFHNFRLVIIFVRLNFLDHLLFECQFFLLYKGLAEILWVYGSKFDFVVESPIVNTCRAIGLRDVYCPPQLQMLMSHQRHPRHVNR